MSMNENKRKEEMSACRAWMVDLAVGKSRRESKWEQVRVSWGRLVERLSQTARTGETYGEYIRMEKGCQDEIKDVGGFVGGYLREGRRRKGDVIFRSVLCLDVDFGEVDFWERAVRVWDFACCLYSTHKHSQATPRFRVVVPLSRVVTEEEYEPLARKVAAKVGLAYFDETTYEASRLMYWPSTSFDGEFVFRVQEGLLLEVEKVLGEYEDWKDKESWPRATREKIVRHEREEKEVSPTEKPGLIGAFCRAYSIEDAIEHFLGNIYEKCETVGSNRYTYLHGTTTGGAVVFGGSYLYSHHGTDPAQGRSLNAFDLVRIHLFGHLDQEVGEECEMSKRPSYREMCRWAMENPKVMKELRGRMRQENKGEEVQHQVLGEEGLVQERVTTYITVTAKGKSIINTSLLAKYIRGQCSYIVVRKKGYDNEFLYWYEKGHYRLVSPNEFKGKIKAFIPEEIRRPSQWEDVYRELLTDSSMVEFEDLDRCQDIINVRNGMYDLKTKTLMPHTDEVYSTIQLACEYEVESSKPVNWLDFIETLTEGDASLGAILQEWFGLTLSNIPGYRTKKCLGLAGAVGNTGKTQYNNMLAHIIGMDFVCATPLQDYEKNFGMGTVYGAKAILIDDQSADSIQDSSNFKKLTGGGIVDCEMKGKQSFPYIFKGTITFGCNDLPYFKGDKGDHVFERFIIIPCDNVIPPEKRRGDILENFKKETNGIFLWALEGLHRLMANEFKFTYSERAHKMLEEYKGMNDSLYKYVKEHYQMTGEEKDRVTKKAFEESYHKWALENDIEPIKKKNISYRAAKHNIRLKKSNNLYYTGITRQV